MATYEKLTHEEARAYERYRGLQRRRAAAELQYARARASARLAAGVAASIPATADPEELERKQGMEQLAGAAQALAGRSAAARRFTEFRLVRTHGSWRGGD